MSLDNIFAQPSIIYDGSKTNIIKIYPIKAIDYEKFLHCSSLLYLSKNHFDESVRHYPLLELLFYSYKNFGLTLEKFIKNLCDLFSLVTLHNVCFVEQDGFVYYEKLTINEKEVEIKKIIHSHNYEEIRTVIMKQNLMHEQKFYKTEIMQKWAEKAMLAKQKNSPNITFEDVISTISVSCGKNYSDLKNYTIYQIYSDFYRLRKMVDYDTNIQFRCAGADIKFQDYAENLDLYHNPYDDLFVSSDKLSGLNKVIK